MLYITSLIETLSSLPFFIFFPVLLDMLRYVIVAPTAYKQGPVSRISVSIIVTQNFSFHKAAGRLTIQV